MSIIKILMIMLMREISLSNTFCNILNHSFSTSNIIWIISIFYIAERYCYAYDIALANAPNVYGNAIAYAISIVKTDKSAKLMRMIIEKNCANTYLKYIRNYCTNANANANEWKCM